MHYARHAASNTELRDPCQSATQINIITSLRTACFKRIVHVGNIHTSSNTTNQILTSMWLRYQELNMILR